MTHYWLMKSEPDVYGWDDLVRDGEGYWDGVRNAQAANNIKAMAPGDRALFYHSNIGLAAVGVMAIIAPAEPDRTDSTGRWVAVRVAPVAPLPKPVTLKAMKAEPALAGLAILRHSRLSVSPVSAEHWQTIVTMAAFTEV